MANNKPCQKCYHLKQKEKERLNSKLIISFDTDHIECDDCTVPLLLTRPTIKL